MTTVVVTLSNAARLDHVQAQVEGVRRWMPDAKHLCIALADAEVLRAGLPDSVVVPGAMNLAGARNLGGDAAVDKLGARCVIFLDADCIPGPSLERRYRQCLELHPEDVAVGPVTYLAHGEGRNLEALDDLIAPHPARRNPADGTYPAFAPQERGLFWSLSFAVAADTWRGLRGSTGGFDEGYTGYGGEDTDFAYLLGHHGIGLRWAGGAHAYHQWHPVSSPPWEHLDDILRNAGRFYERWGIWPMEGWLEAFAKEGAIQFRNRRWRRVTADGGASF